MPHNDYGGGVGPVCYHIRGRAPQFGGQHLQSITPWVVFPPRYVRWQKKSISPIHILILTKFYKVVTPGRACHFCNLTVGYFILLVFLDFSPKLLPFALTKLFKFYSSFFILISLKDIKKLKSESQKSEAFFSNRFWKTSLELSV